MKDLIIVGAGGHGREVIEWVIDINKENPTWNVLGFIDDNLNTLDDKKVSIKSSGKYTTGILRKINASLWALLHP
ncbi:MAG: hypothetical protein NHB14_24660 [Desulfosporosinus sp.]|nr:hypothetical protein [Desulfosporosinus sp.]